MQVAAAISVDAESPLGLLEHAIGLSPLATRLAASGFGPKPG